MFKEGLSNFLVAMYLSVFAIAISMISLAVPNLHVLCIVNTFLATIITGFIITYFVFGIKWLLTEKDFSLRVSLVLFGIAVLALSFKCVVGIVYAFNQDFVVTLINNIASVIANLAITLAYSALIAGTNDRINGYSLDNVLRLGFFSKLFLIISTVLGIAYIVLTYFFNIPDVACICISLILGSFSIAAHILLIVYTSKAITKIDKEEMLQIESFA